MTNLTPVQIFKSAVFCIVLCCLTACASAPEPSDSPTNKKLRAAKINIRLGIAYLDRNDIKRSKQKFLTALEQGPNLPECWYGMAYFLEKTGNPQQANEYYQKAMKLAPDRGDTLNNYGTYLCRNGKYKESISYFMKATKDKTYLDPSAAYENAGLCAMKIPDKSLAMRYFQRALEEDPTRPTSLLEMAELHYDAKNFFAATYHLKQYQKLAPANPASTSLEERLKKQA